MGTCTFVCSKKIERLQMKWQIEVQIRALRVLGNKECMFFENSCMAPHLFIKRRPLLRGRLIQVNKKHLFMINLFSARSYTLR